MPKPVPRTAKPKPSLRSLAVAVSEKAPPAFKEGDNSTEARAIRAFTNYNRRRHVMASWADAPEAEKRAWRQMIVEVSNEAVRM